MVKKIHWKDFWSVTESSKPGSALLMHIQQSETPTSGCRESGHLLQGAKQGEWVANAQGPELTMPFKQGCLKAKSYGQQLEGV